MEGSTTGHACVPKTVMLESRLMGVINQEGRRQYGGGGRGRDKLTEATMPHCSGPLMTRAKHSWAWYCWDMVLLGMA